MSGSPASYPPLLMELNFFWRLDQFQHVDDDGCSLVIQWSANLPVRCVSRCQEMLPFWPFPALLPAELAANTDEVLSFPSVESHSLAPAHFSTHCLSATCAPVWSNRMEKSVTHAGKSFVSWDFCLHDVDTLLFPSLVWSALTSGCWRSCGSVWGMISLNKAGSFGLFSFIQLFYKRCSRVIITSQMQKDLMELIADMQS